MRLRVRLRPLVATEEELERGIEIPTTALDDALGGERWRRAEASRSSARKRRWRTRWPPYLEDPSCANYGVLVVWRNYDRRVPPLPSARWYPDPRGV